MTEWQQSVDALQTACLQAFGVPVVYTPSLDNRMELGGTPVNLTGIYNENLENVSLMGRDSVGIDAVVPRSTVEIKVSDLGFDPMAGDEVTLVGLTFRILEVETDVNGMSVLFLDRQQDPFSV